MIKLFHGSYIEVSTPLVKLGRQKVDFGQGLYLTNLQSQAESWAQTISERKGRDANAVLSRFEFDFDGVISAGFVVKSFDNYNLEWLDYVVDCRRGGELQRLYDVVEGGVANDDVIDTVEDFENGIITAEQALGQLIYKKINHQICILNQQIIDDGFLKFVSSVVVSKK